MEQGVEIVKCDDFVTRSYQSEIMDIALKQNTIIYLPTGSGKTYIAILLIKQLSGAIVKKLEEGGKITVFLVNTVALVEQHHLTIKRHTDFDIGRFTGDMNVDFWTRNQWTDQLNKYQIVVLTAQIFLDIVRHGYFSLEHVNLLIFDECHQGVENHAMRQIMKLFENVPKRSQPRVLGLTATLLNSNCKPYQVQQLVISLETTYHSKVATVQQLADVLGFSTNPNERIEYYEKESKNNIEITAHIKDMIERLTKFIVSVNFDPPKDKNDKRQSLDPPNKVAKDLKNILLNFEIHLDMLGLYGAWKAALFYMIHMERLKRQTDDELIEQILSVISTQLTAIKKLLEDEMRDVTNEMEKIYKYSTPRTQKLLQVLRDFKDKKNLCGIVFVERRFTAKLLYYIIKSLSNSSEDFNFISTDFLVGLNANPSEKENTEALFSSKMAKRVMRSFNDGDINLLIASNVVEEGIDIPRCTLVVKFDYPTNYRSYIQSKGRARHRDSHYVMMVPVTERTEFCKRYEAYQEVEKLLELYLVGKNEERSIPTDSEIQRELYDDHDMPPYYVDGPNSPHVTIVSAISLLNRYCQSLCRDRYSQPAPSWFLEKYGAKCVVVIEMPIMCPLRKTIRGPPMDNKQSAKKAAALVVCEMLHKIGELTNNLLPQNEVMNIEENYEYLFTHWINEDVTDVKPKPGTKKSKRNHDIVTSSYLIGKELTHSMDLYLHIIGINPNFSGMTKSAYNLAMQYELMHSDLSFGLLTAKPFPKLCDFPLFISSGELNIHIEVNAKRVNLTKEQLRKLRFFNRFVYEKIMRILKDFLVYDNSSDAGTILLVPIMNGLTEPKIAYDVIDLYTKYNVVEEPTTQFKANINVTNDSYLAHVVIPWYRMSDTHYIVTRVCHGLSALAPFPSNDFDSYVHYFNDKYDVNIVNPHQPLLLVKAMSKKLNCLKPRSITLHGSKRNKQVLQDEFEEHLVPEMCTKQDFPAALWYQSYFIPSILHRIEFLLRADDLRRTINQATGIGVVFLPNHEQWDPLKVDSAILKDEEKKPQPVPQRNVAEGAVIALPPTTVQVPKTRPTNKDYARKMLEQMYPWTDEQEPIDIERNIETVRLMEIIDYEKFIAPKDPSEKKSVNSMKTDLPAIEMKEYYSDYEYKPIKMYANERINKVGPQLWEMYQVLMTAKANDVVNFERLETLGDSFLKLSVSLFLLLKYPLFNEGRLTNIKGKVIGNRNLYYIGLMKQLGGMLKCTEFSPSSDWLPPGYGIPEVLRDKIDNNILMLDKLFEFEFNEDEQISGILSNKTLNTIEEQTKQLFEEIEDDEEEKFSSMNKFRKLQTVQDKTISDCVEAVIGVYLNSNGLKGALGVLGWLGVIPEEENPVNLFKSKPPSPFFFPTDVSEVDKYLPNYKKLEQHLGYQFKNRGYLLQALTHASYTSSRITDCYQRLEFLGDAVLDFLITCHIYETSVNLTPGQLTDLRSALVNNVTFAGLSVRFGFHKYLKSMNTKLIDVIDTFVRYQEERNFVINEEILILSEEDTDKMMAEHVHIPKVLGDLFEALAGAVFLDSGLSLEETWSVFHRLMYKEIELFRVNVPKSPVRLLYECATAAPHFDVAKVIENGVTMVGLAVIVEGKKQVVHGFGENKPQAKRAAAKLALRLLQKNNKVSNY